MGFAWVAWLLTYIARVGVKVRVGLEKLYYERTNICNNLLLRDNKHWQGPTGSNIGPTEFGISLSPVLSG